MILCFSLLCFVNVFYAQDLSSIDILNKSIEYHDPDEQWKVFKSTLIISQSTPSRPDSERRIFMDRVSGEFSYVIGRDGGEVECLLSPDTCKYWWNENHIIPDSIKVKYQLTPERAEMYRNYYLYLYGLPMKLKDEGTILQDTFEEVTFFDRDSYKLKVTYKEEVGSDIWYFYFDKNTFAMVAYQFFHDESKKDGEYILLEKEKRIQDIRIPKIRTWYTNAEGKLLGTDTLR
jgi:hypothetical protein